MTGNCAQEHYFVLLNVKLQVKFRFKRFYGLLNLICSAFILNTTTKMACFAQNFYNLATIATLV